MRRSPPIFTSLHSRAAWSKPVTALDLDISILQIDTRHNSVRPNTDSSVACNSQMKDTFEWRKRSALVFAFSDLPIEEQAARLTAENLGNRSRAR